MGYIHICLRAARDVAVQRR